MKKLALAFAAAILLSGCVGFTEGKSKTTGKKTHDMYVLHPVITIAGYTSQL
jgi:PBP1b-binding outer membrane lipoprotein LpoB